MSKAGRSNSAKAAYADSPLAKINRARKIGAALNAMPYTEANKERLAMESYKLPTSTLDEYQRMTGEAAKNIDNGREPFLIDKEMLDMGMHPMVEVWDVAKDRHTVSTGKGKQEMVMICLQRGDALLPPDTLLVWR